MKKIAWSWSRIDTFEQCPRKFQLQNITKELPFVPNEATERGTQFHKWMEDSVNGRPISPRIKDPRGNLEKILAFIRSGDYFNAEEQITYDANWNEVTWFAKNAWVRCAFDAITITGSQAYIFDWKTGRVKEQVTDQLALNALICMKKYPQVQSVKTAYVWLDHPTAPPTLDEYYRRDEAWLEENFRARADAINVANIAGQWPEKENRFCKWCNATAEQCSRKAQYG